MDLQYYRTFNEDTSQGVVGLLRPLRRGSNNQKIFKLEHPGWSASATDYFFVKDDPTHPIYVFKIPKEVNSLVDHELKVSRDMEELSVYLPHFNRVMEVKRSVKCYIPSEKALKETPAFNPFSQYNCVRDVLIAEYIPSNLTFLKFIKSAWSHGYDTTTVTDALIHQLAIALMVAQQEKNFTHYDLHLENILLRRCLERTFFWYKFMYEGAVINRLVYTKGYFPVIFDYGFAYSKGLEHTNYNNSLFFTNKGYTPFMFDKINDFKSLLVRLAYNRNCPSKFKRIADEQFLKSSRLNFELSKETGWIKSTTSSAARIACKKLNKIIESIDADYKNNFIYKELDNIVDLYGILIKLPIGQNSFDSRTLDGAVEVFLAEWKKIDVWFSSAAADDKLNIIKRIFETINELIEENSDTPHLTRNRQESLKQAFKLRLFEIFDAFGDFVNVENLNYGKFLSSILEISNFLEHIVYAEVQRHKKLFNFNLDSWTLFTMIENLVEPKEPHNFKLGDSIVLFDCMDKSTSSFDLKDHDIIEALNLASNTSDQIRLLDSLPLKDISDEYEEEK